VKCTFSVAEFSLSPLIARLESHSYEAASQVPAAGDDLSVPMTEG